MPAGPIEDRLERRWVLEGRLHEPSDHRFVHSADGTAGVFARVTQPAVHRGARPLRLNLGVYLETPTSVTMTPRCGGPSSTQRGTAPRRSAREQRPCRLRCGVVAQEQAHRLGSHHKSNAAGSAALSERTSPAIRRRREVAGPTPSRTGGWVAISRPTTASSPSPRREAVGMMVVGNHFGIAAAGDRHPDSDRKFAVNLTTVPAPDQKSSV